MVHANFDKEGKFICLSPDEDSMREELETYFQTLLKEEYEEKLFRKYLVQKLRKRNRIARQEREQSFFYLPKIFVHGTTACT